MVARLPEEHAGAPAEAAYLRQLGLLARQTARTPVAVILADSFVLWLFVRHASLPWFYVWFAVSAALLFGRMSYFRRLSARPVEDQLRSGPVVMGWFFCIGLARAWMVAMAANAGAVEEQYLVTMISVGLAAGAVGSVGGMVRPWGAWVTPLTLGLLGLWISNGTVEGYWIAVLLVLLFVLLTLHVRDYGRMLVQQVELTESLRTERDRAEQAIAARTRFFAAASHDLRQPLAVLRWYGDAVLLHAQHLQHEPLQSIGQGIARAVEHAEPMVRKYLDIARLEAGAVEVNPERIDVARLLQDVCESFAQEAQTRALALRLELTASAAPLCVWTDRGHARSILDNLTGNALKYTRHGSVVLSACIVERDDGQRVRIEVRDTGIGITPAHQVHIFDEFYQVDNPQRSAGQGLGLGLSIARRQARLIGTEIELQSAVGHGSVFAFELPAAAGAASPAADLVPVSWPSRQVVVVDDEADVRHALQTLLVSAGWGVRTASDLDGVLRVAGEGFVPDAILVDYRLANHQTGAKLLEELAARGCCWPAVFLTGDTAPDRLREIAAEGRPVLHKPVALEEIVAKVGQVLGDTPSRIEPRAVQ
jgi:signal transduction histidine kinase/CheY-like chemotaxis protein